MRRIDRWALVVMSLSAVVLVRPELIAAPASCSSRCQEKVYFYVCAFTRGVEQRDPDCLYCTGAGQKCTDPFPVIDNKTCQATAVFQQYRSYEAVQYLCDCDPGILTVQYASGGTSSGEWENYDFPTDRVYHCLAP